MNTWIPGVGGGGGGGGWGGGDRMNLETGFDIYTLLCIKEITNENLLYSTGNITQCSLVI